MDKADLRKALLAARRAMAPDEAACRNELILEKLTHLSELRESPTVLCYVSSKDNEADTRALIQWLLDQGKTVLVPVSQGRRQLLWSRLLSLDELARGRFGILEPRLDCRRDTAAPDEGVVLVPGVAFDRRGYRIGYGGGYYDMFMAGFRGPKVAIAFESQMVEAVPVEVHDMAVDAVVTDVGVYRCKSERVKDEKGQEPGGDTEPPGGV